MFGCFSEEIVDRKYCDVSLLNGDVLDRLCGVADGSIDLIAADLPYETTRLRWDRGLDFEALWREMRRVLSPSGTIVMTGSGLFTHKMIGLGLDLYRHQLVWEKSRATNFVHAKHRPLAAHEDVLIFSKGKVGRRATRRMTYNPQGLVELTAPRKGTVKASMSEHYADNGYTFERKQTHTNYPRSVLRFDSVHSPQHPTQKPVELFDWIVRTYSNPGDVVLDPTMGSGTTGVAAVAAGRAFIGIERDAKYFEIAAIRINEVTGGDEPISRPTIPAIPATKTEPTRYEPKEPIAPKPATKSRPTRGAPKHKNVWTPSEQAMWDQKREALRRAKAQAVCEVVTLYAAISTTARFELDDLPLAA